MGDKRPLSAVAATAGDDTAKRRQWLVWLCDVVIRRMVRLFHDHGTGTVTGGEGVWIIIWSVRFSSDYSADMAC